MLLAAVRRRDEPDGSGCYGRRGQTQGGAPRQSETINADRVPAVVLSEGNRMEPAKGLPEFAHGGATRSSLMAAFRAYLRTELRTVVRAWPVRGTRLVFVTGHMQM